MATEEPKAEAADTLGLKVIEVSDAVREKLDIKGGVQVKVAEGAAAKAGLLHLTRALALEWARHGIRVNALAPGYIATDLNREFFASPAGEALIKRVPQRRLGQPQDLDGPLLLLASDASAFMTGSVIDVDGGHLASSL